MSIQFALFTVVAVITSIFTFAQKDKKTCIKVITIILACFSGFRSWRYGDLMHYCFAFLKTNLPDWKLDFSNNTDTIGLQILYRIFGQLGLGFEGLIFFVSAFSAIALGIIVYRYSSSHFFSYIIYIALGNYIFTFSALKQTIASALILLSFSFIVEKKPIKFMAVILLAFIFHKPAILFLLAYFAANKKIDKYYFLILGSVIFAVSFFIEEIVTWFSEVYYGTMEFVANEDVGLKQVVMIAIVLLAAFLRPPKEFDRAYKCLFSIMAVASIIQSFAAYDNVFSRLADYFFQFSVLFIPFMLEIGDEQAKKMPEYSDKIKYRFQRYYPFIKLAIIVFSAIYYYISLKNSGDLVDGFKFFWQDNEESSKVLLERFIDTGTLA